MSVLVGAAQGLGFGWQGYSADMPTQILDDQYRSLENDGTITSAFHVGDPVEGWATEWWPTRGCFCMDSGLGDIMRTGQSMQLSQSWFSGANGRFSFAGIARDFNGNVISGATVRCYRVSDGVAVAAPVTTDANGYFLITTPYSPDTHFLTVHKSGASPYAGASYDNLVGG